MYLIAALIGVLGLYMVLLLQGQEVDELLGVVVLGVVFVSGVELVAYITRRWGRRDR